MYIFTKPLFKILISISVFCSIALVCFNAQAQFWKKETQTLLPDHEAFIESAYVQDSSLIVSWQIADDYYMYRDQFDVIAITPGLRLGQAEYPEGLVEDDPEFGEVVVYFNRVEYAIPILAFPNSGDTLNIDLKAQGCNKPVGVCYAPQSRSASLNYVRPANSALKSTPNKNTNSDSKSEEKSFWAYVLAALGAGILLSFTPCVLPMIPILAGVIAGQKNPSKLRSGWLAICYVLGTLVTYAIAGWVAGASGIQLQAYFQSPWVISVICGFLLILAASLFGAFKIQLPSSIQTKLNSASLTSKSASVSSFGLGLISALVVGACVSPILIVTLGAAISKGDPVLGAAIMSSMALGMGSLLIVFGFGAGWLLPRTGAWMNHIQVLFGFMVLGVAIFIASALPAIPAMYLWAALLLWSGCYLLKFASQVNAELTSSLLRGAGIATLIWGAMALIGASTGGKDILKPLNAAQFLSAGATQQQTKLPFKVVTSAEEAKALLAKAKAAGKPALIDFYADWCLDCKRMDQTTFLQASVHSAVQDWALIKIDVTTTGDASETVKQYFDVFGPPATLFYKPNGAEHTDLRQYGYLKESDFLAIIARASN